MIITHDQICRFTPVLEAARSFCYFSTPENRRKLHEALRTYAEESAKASKPVLDMEEDHY